MKRVLVIEEDAERREQVSMHLYKGGFQAILEEKPARILRHLEAEPIAVILLDAHIENGKGLIYLDKLKKLESYYDIPVIMMLEQHHEVTLKECFDLGAADCLHKPLHPGGTLARIDHVLALQRHRRSMAKSLRINKERLTDEIRNRLETEQSLEKLKTSWTNWANLPREIQGPLEQVLMQFNPRINILDNDMKEALVRITARFGEILGSFLEMSQERNKSSEFHFHQRINILRNLPLFQNLSNFDLNMLAKQMQEEAVGSNHAILEQGKPANGVYFLEKGMVEIWVNNELVAHGKEGQSFGEMSCLRNEANASATVRTLVASQLLRIDRDVFMKIVSRLPQLWIGVYKDLTNRFQTINLRLSQLYQNIPQGFLQIDSSGQITNQYSKQCIELLGVRMLVGKPAHKLLFQESTEQEGWQQIFPLFFESSQVDFDMMAELLPRETSLRHPNGTLREIRLTYHPCYGQNDRLVAIDVGMEDISREKELDRKNRQMQVEQHIYQKLYQNPESYFNLLHRIEESETYLRTLLREIQADQGQPACLSAALRSFHTLKGISGVFQLSRLAKLIHEIEESCRSIQTSDRVYQFHQHQLERYLNDLVDKHQYVRGLFDNLHAESQRRLTGLNLSPQEMETIRHLLEQGDAASALKRLQQLELVDIKQLVLPWRDEVQTLAKRLGKQIEVVVEGDPISIPSPLFYQLQDTLLHIVRNSADHGIETPAERQALGKNSTGQINLIIQESGQEMLLKIGDDGRGVNLEELISKARHNKLLDKDQVKAFISSGEPWRLMFLAGLTTRQDVSDISGRGVGLDAVATLINHLKGTIEFTTQLGQGTQFTITLPLNPPN